MGAWDKEPLAEARRPLEGGRLHPCQVTGAGWAGLAPSPAPPTGSRQCQPRQPRGASCVPLGTVVNFLQATLSNLALTLSKHRLRLKKLAGRVKGVEALCDPAGSHPEGRCLMVGRSWSFLRPLSPELSVQRIVGPEGHWGEGAEGTVWEGAGADSHMAVPPLGLAEVPRGRAAVSNSGCREGPFPLQMRPWP